MMDRILRDLKAGASTNVHTNQGNDMEIEGRDREFETVLETGSSFLAQAPTLVIDFGQDVTDNSVGVIDIKPRNIIVSSVIEIEDDGSSSSNSETYDDPEPIPIESQMFPNHTNVKQVNKRRRVKTSETGKRMKEDVHGTYRNVQ